jgi:hypothetical protein
MQPMRSLNAPTARRLSLANDQFRPVSMILHVRMNMQFNIRQLTDVSGCNLQENLSCTQARQATT